MQVAVYYPLCYVLFWVIKSRICIHAEPHIIPHVSAKTTTATWYLNTHFPEYSNIRFLTHHE